MEMIIGGKKRGSRDGARMPIVNPATGETVDTVPVATAADVEDALDRARTGQMAWRAVPLHERARIFGAFVAAAETRREELAQLLSREMGKPIRDARAEIGSIAALFLGYAEKAKHLCGSTLPVGAEPGIEADFAVTVREPLGVVACIIPFNFPIDLLCHKVAPALIMGNAVVVKPPSSNPSACIRAMELLLESGVPGDAAQVLTGRGSELGPLLAGSPKIDMVTFTGSTSVALEIAARAAPNMTRTLLECGGNDPLIVFGDADLDEVVQLLLISRANNAGQTCCSTKRVIVHNSIRRALEEKLVDALAKLKVGDPLDPATDVGCLVSESAAKEVERAVAVAVSQGATCACGGTRAGAFFDPTVLTGVRPDMDISRDREVFGPVFPIIGFDTPAQAVAIANGTKYGLQGAVMCRDIDTAMKTASLLECGAVIINGSSRYRSSEMAFGGYKKSGLGREGISHTLEEMSQVKTIVMRGVFG